MLQEREAVDAMGWEPILEGRLADEARAAVRDIAEHILVAPGALDQPDEPTLFWAYAAGVFDDEESCARYDQATCALIASIERGHRRHLQLHGGLAGAAWTLAHIAQPDSDSDALLAAVDRTLLAALSAERWERDYDLIGGLTGHGVYFLERLSSGANGREATEGLALIVGHLEALAEQADVGVTWHTAPKLLPPWQRELWPEGYYNLGVAHGVPGVIALLGRIAALPDPPAGADRLCAEAARWTRAQRRSSALGGYFPNSVSRGDTARDQPRTAWCYGDPGVAAALWSSAVRTGAPADEWRALAAECAARPDDRCNVIDPSLCHGALGLAHLFNRFYQASRDPRFRAASCAWFERGLAMRRPGEGIAGFLARAWDPDTGASSWAPATGLLEGAAGIGLALLAGLSSEEPGWDRRLLCDVPCRT